MKRGTLRCPMVIAVMQFAAVVLLLTAPVMAQDIGIPDTVRYEPAETTWDVDFHGNTFTIELWEWCDDNTVYGASLGFEMETSTGGGLGHDDSLIVVDTFMFYLSADMLYFQWSAIDGTTYPDAIHNDFNGYLLGIINIMGGNIFPMMVPSRIGTLRLKIPDPTLLPASFDITLDSTWFPPGNQFVFAPGLGETFTPQFIPATIHVDNIYGGTDPMIQLNPTAFDFTATEGGSDPSDQTLFITNGGSGSLSWNASDDAAWLTLMPASGSGDGSVTLSVDIDGMTTGEYSATITVTDPYAVNSPQYASVTLTIEHPIPVIELSPTSLSYSAFTAGADPAGQTFSITNTGEGVLDWTATPDEGWLTVDPTSGAGDGTVSVTVDKSGMPPGLHYAAISVTDPWASNSPQDVAVTLELHDTPPVIGVDRRFIYFDKLIGEPDPPLQALTISNLGGQILDWTASKTNDWLVLSASSGTAPSTINVSIVGDEMSPDLVFDTILVSGLSALNTPELVIVGVSVHNDGEFSWGDADCSGAVDIDDVVYLINYIFASGPPPGDPDNDGTPNCP